MTQQFDGLIFFFGLGDALRVLSEPQGEILQTEEENRSPRTAGSSRPVGALCSQEKFRR